MESNKFELTGRINFIDVKCTEKGMCITKLLMSKKGKTDELKDYQSFNITFFGELAEQIGNTITKGDMVNITGRMQEDKYEKDGKTISRLSLIGNTCVLAEYDKDKKQYIEVKSINKKSDNTEEVPW